MTRLLYLLLLCSHVCPISLNAQTKAPTLRELMEAAIAKDFGLANQRLDLEATEVELQGLSDAYLPRVDLSASESLTFTSFAVKSQDIQIPQLDIDIKTGRNRFSMLSNMVAASAGGKMLLYSGGKIPHLKKALAEKGKAQQAIMEKFRQEIIGEVTAAYDRLALLRQIRTVLDESEKRLAENKRVADKAFGYGLITRYEHQKIDVAIAQLASKIQDYEGKRSLVLKQLVLLTDVEEDRIALIENEMSPLYGNFTDINIEQRAELKALDAIAEANRFRIKAEKTWFVPKVQGSASIGYLGLTGGHLWSRDPVSLTSEKLSAKTPGLHILPTVGVGVGFRWDLLDGHVGRREVRKAEIELDKNRNEKKEAEEKLELNLVRSRTDYASTIAQIEARGKQRQTADNALKQATREYQTGLIRSSQLVDAEQDFQQAALDYVQAVFNQRRAYIDLLKATGNLTIQSIQ
jgi:outer membrane protein TolC